MSWILNSLVVFAVVVAAIDASKVVYGRKGKKGECRNDGDCPKREICENGLCVPEECWGDKDCRKGERCHAGRCVGVPRPKHRSGGYPGVKKTHDYRPQKPGCRNDRDCGKDMSCYRGNCVADCMPCYRRNKHFECELACDKETQHCDGHRCVCNYGYVEKKRGRCVSAPAPRKYKGPGFKRDHYDGPQPYKKGGPYRGPGPKRGYDGPDFKRGRKDCYDGKC